MKKKDVREDGLQQAVGSPSDVLAFIVCFPTLAVATACDTLSSRIKRNMISNDTIERWISNLTDYGPMLAKECARLYRVLTAGGYKMPFSQKKKFLRVFCRKNQRRIFHEILWELLESKEFKARHMMELIDEIPAHRYDLYYKLWSVENLSTLNSVQCLKYPQTRERAYTHLCQIDKLLPTQTKAVKRELMSILNTERTSNSVRQAEYFAFMLLCQWGLVTGKDLVTIKKIPGLKQIAGRELKKLAKK